MVVSLALRLCLSTRTRRLHFLSPRCDFRFDLYLNCGSSELVKVTELVLGARNRRRAVVVALFLGFGVAALGLLRALSPTTHPARNQFQKLLNALARSGGSLRSTRAAALLRLAHHPGLWAWL